MRRILIGLMVALIGGPAFAQATTMTGAVNSPSGTRLTLNPFALYNQACNGGAGGMVGQTYTATLCEAPAATIPTGGATAANQTTQITAVGSPGATACATDTASCSTNQQMQRLAQRLTSLITATGSPLQAGGNVALLGGNFQIAPTITAATTSHAAGDSVGGVITVTGAARTSGGTGLVDALRLKSAAGITGTMWFYAWSKTPAATCTDDLAYVASASDSPYALPGFPVAGSFGAAPGVWDAGTAVQIGGLTANFKNQDASPGTAIYMCLVLAATTSITAADLSLVVGGAND